MAPELAREELATIVPVWEAFLAERENLFANYDRKMDTLYLCRRSARHRPALSFDVDGEFWLRLDPSTNEVLAIEVEDFVHHFLPRHVEIQRAWRDAAAKHLLILNRRPERKPTFIAFIIEKLQELFRSDPRQLNFA